MWDTPFAERWVCVSWDVGNGENENGILVWLWRRRAALPFFKHPATRPAGLQLEGAVHVCGFGACVEGAGLGTIRPACRDLT